MLASEFMAPMYRDGIHLRPNDVGMAGYDSAAGSCSSRQSDVDALGLGLALFQALGDDAQGKCLCLDDRLFLGRAIGQNPRQFKHFCQPPTVVFLLHSMV